MLICPKCKREYQPGYKTCSDCKCDLIEIPDRIEDKSLVKAGSTLLLSIIFLIAGMILIYRAPILSYQNTLDYFIPNGSGCYNGEHYTWMLNAYQHSLLVIGGILCLAGLICLVGTLSLIKKSENK
jgi:hypothetical protein